MSGDPTIGHPASVDVTPSVDEGTVENTWSSSLDRHRGDVSAKQACATPLRASRNGVRRRAPAAVTSDARIPVARAAFSGSRTVARLELRQSRSCVRNVKNFR